VDLSVIIVTFNSRSVLEPCLESLKKQTLFASTEVIVVDNASSDGTPGFVRDRYPWVQLYAGEENVGFSRGVNLGIRRARGKYFLILNPDTVVRDDAIEKLQVFMEETTDAGIVGPKLVFHDGNLQQSCRRFYNWKVLLLRRTFLGKIFRNSRAVSEHLMEDFDHQSTRAVDWVLGAAMLVRREAVEAVGLMDERFFLYFEDVDWCYRMKQKGWVVYYHPDAVVVHNYARQSAQSVLNRSFIAHFASLVRYYDKWSWVLYFLKKYREVAKVATFLVADVAAFNLAFLSAYYLRVVLDNVFTNPIYPIAAYERFVIFENLLFVFTYFALGLYRIRRETTSVDELFDIAKAIVLASVLLMTSTYLGQIRTYSRMVVAFLVPFAVVYDLILRGLVRSFHRRLLAYKIDLKRVCIVGPPSEARALGLKLEADATLGLDVVGIVADAADADAGGVSGLIGDTRDLERVVDEYRIQELVILPGAVPDDRIAELVTMGRRRVLDVTVLTDYAGLVMRQAEVMNLAGRPVIAYQRDTRFMIDRSAKRLLDVVIGTLFLVVSLPFSVLYSIYASVRGGTRYVREPRLGHGGTPFNLPLAGAGSSNGPSDIVNLPLFWLVITGKMSMVGPYAIPAQDGPVVGAARFRFDMRPGITGYWRVGTDEEVPLGDLLAQDANYIRNWSLVEDLKILVTTFGNIMRGRKRSLRIRQPRQK
jgi:GT2 family glycosyltransferase/lipopolysaccharide/colanic/teichoic acid biosynthesis glycosyltransferase